MPAKPRRKGRRPQYKNKARQQQATAQPAQNAAATPGASAAPITAKPISKTAPVSTKATTAQYPFFTSELKKIGIIGGIIVVILIILAIILT